MCVLDKPFFGVLICPDTHVVYMWSLLPSTFALPAYINTSILAHSGAGHNDVFSINLERAPLIMAPEILAGVRRFWGEAVRRVGSHFLSSVFTGRPIPALEGAKKTQMTFCK